MEKRIADNNNKDKKTKLKKFKLNKSSKITIGIVGGIISAAAIIGLIFGIIYGATLGTVTLNGFCMADASCIKNSSMSCVSSACTCISPLTWNSSNSKCVSTNTTTSTSTVTTVTTTTTTTATPTLTPYQKAIKLLYTRNYSTFSVTTFSGGTYTNAFDVRTFTNNLNVMYIYVCDHNQGILAMYYENGTFFKQASIPGALYFEIMQNGNIYVSRYTSQRVDIYDQMLNYLNYYANTNFITQAYGIRYFPTTGYLYECDIGTSWINAFDMSLTRQTSQSMAFSGYWPYCISYYQNYLYIGTTSNVILIVQNKAIVGTISSICITNYVTGIDIDQTTGYMFLSCYWDQRVQIWYTNGTQSTRTGYMLQLSANPVASTVDKYGRLIVTRQIPSGFDIYTLIQ